MTADERLAALMAECLSDLQRDTPAGDAGAVAALREIEALAPGKLQQMAARLASRREAVPVH